MQDRAEIVICGAGIAGISSAYHLAVRQGVRDILLVDERPPLSLTSDKSTECYRNWWPGPGDAMVAFMNRSIDLLEELAEASGNVFHLNRRGYLYVTGDPRKIPAFERAAAEPPTLGAGPLRVRTLDSRHASREAYIPAAVDSFAGQPPGADLFVGAELVQRYFPFLTEQAVAALHVRRAGWFSAQQLGMYLLSQARSHGVQLCQARVTGVETAGGRVQAVRLDDGRQVETSCFVDAAGPYLREVGHMVGVDLPVFSEIHLKVAFNDFQGRVPRQVPMLIWTDPQFLDWSAEERELLADDPETAWLLDELPAGVHTRPEGGAGSPVLLMLWEYHDLPVEPVWPPPLDPQYPEIVLRGLVTMLPALQAYIDNATRPQLDGGYYTKTKENRPLIGPLPITGAYVIGALSGYGLMASCAAGELLAAHVTGGKLPAYAPSFRLERYADPAYQQLLANWGDSGQL